MAEDAAHSGRYTFCVALDGSDLSYKALRVALSLAQPKDTIVVLQVNDGSPGGHLAGKGAGVSPRAHTTVEANARVEALKYHIRPEQVREVTVDVTEGESVARRIVTFADRHARHLVIGASGRGAEGRAPSSHARPLGSVAEHCLLKVRNPVILVRGTHGKFEYREPDDVVGKNPRPALRFACAVDNSRVARRAFDRAVSFARAGDAVEVLHVHDGRGSGAPRDRFVELQPIYEAECTKVAATRPGVACAFEGILSKGGESVPRAIAEACEARGVDLLVLGSAELADMSKGFVLGSVAASCARNTDANICVVKNFA